MENLSLARVRRLKNHSSKLQRADGELESDAGIKEPENSRDQSIVNLQETGPLDRGRQHIPPRVTDSGEGGYALEAGAARNIDVTQFLHVLNLFATIVMAPVHITLSLLRGVFETPLYEFGI
jgi:hypothetical protein